MRRKEEVREENALILHKSPSEKRDFLNCPGASSPSDTVLLGRGRALFLLFALSRWRRVLSPVVENQSGHWYKQIKEEVRGKKFVVRRANHYVRNY
jgi:hypothetical protein